MNKKIFFFGGAALLGGAFVALTAFGGMTKAQQMSMIADQVQAQIATLRETKSKECDESVAKAAAAKAQEMLAAPAEAAPAEPVKGAAKPTKKAVKPAAKPAKVDPMPQPAPPAPKPTQPESKSKWNTGGEAKPAQESQSKWAKPADPNAKAADPNAKPASKSKWDKKEGGN